MTVGELTCVPLLPPSARLAEVEPVGSSSASHRPIFAGGARHLHLPAEPALNMVCTSDESSARPKNSTSSMPPNQGVLPPRTEAATWKDAGLPRLPRLAVGSKTPVGTPSM